MERLFQAKTIGALTRKNNWQAVFLMAAGATDADPHFNARKYQSITNAVLFLHIVQ